MIERIVNRRVAPSSGAIYNLVSNPPKVDGICDISGENLVHRKDDQEEVVRKRIEVYASHQADMVKYYSNKGELVKINELEYKKSVVPLTILLFLNLPISCEVPAWALAKPLPKSAIGLL